MFKPNRDNADRDWQSFSGEAVVDEKIQGFRKGRVYFRGTWWPAQCSQGVTLIPGEICQVVGISNITLIVEQLSEIGE